METQPNQVHRQLHRIHDVAAVTGQTYRTIRLAIKAGKIKAVRMGASVRIPDRELRKILLRGY